MDEEIQLIELIQIVLKKKWIIIGITLVMGIMAFAYTNYMVTPVYESKTTLMVNGSKSSDLGDLAAGLDLSSISMSQKLVVTYSEIVKSRIVLEQVIDRMELDLTYNQMLNKITAVPVKSTEILNITVTDKDPEQASLMANEIADVFIKEVIRILKVNNVEIIDQAIPINQDINVHVLLNTAIGILLGGMIGVGLVFLLYYLDQSIKTADDVALHLDLPVLGSIVDFSKEKTS